MRGIILFLLMLMILISGNIAAYVMSEDYRFFLKKIKYQQELVYEQEVVDDSQRYSISSTLDSVTGEVRQVIVPEESVTFLDILASDEDETPEDELPSITSSELEVIDAISQAFVLREQEQTETLFGLTDEYPDEFRQYSNVHMSLYLFSSKRYSSVKNIFEVLSYELPIEFNEVNNFGDASFFINMQEGSDDGLVRIVFEYEKYAFGLKIKKDNYNRVREALEQLKALN